MKQTARAVLTNHQGLCFLALHNHYLPENIGKWGTIGGIMDASDPDILHCLRRELGEEFAGEGDFEIGKKLGEIEKNGVLHHFFHVRTARDSLEVAQPEEILDARFMSLAELISLKENSKLYFGREEEFYTRALNEPGFIEVVKP